MTTIAMAFDSGIYKGARATIISSMISNHGKPLSFVVLDGGVSIEQKSEIESIVSVSSGSSIRWIEFDKSKVSGFVSHQEFTHMTYARILLPELLDAPSCIYLDSDILVFSKFEEIERAASGSIMAASPDGDGSTVGMYPWHPDPVSSTFINSGVMWINLDEWRKERIHDQILDFLSKESARCKWADQNAINWILRGRIRILESRFNTMANDIDTSNIKLDIGRMNIHYASGMKPWKRPIPTISHTMWRRFNSRFESEASKLTWSASDLLKYLYNNAKYFKSNPIFSRSLSKDLKKYDCEIEEIIRISLQ